MNNDDNTTHRERVAEYVKENPKRLKKLFEQAVDTRKKGFGPAMPDYAKRKLRTICYLSGANLILLEQLIDEAQAKMPEGNKSKESRSSFINMMIEFWLEHKDDI